jgi:hypothetical protein
MGKASNEWKTDYGGQAPAFGLISPIYTRMCLNVTYIPANARIPATSRFCLRGMSKSRTMKKGKIPNVQSANELMIEAVYDVARTILGPRQVPYPGECFHQAETGLH